MMIKNKTAVTGLIRKILCCQSPFILIEGVIEEHNGLEVITAYDITGLDESKPGTMSKSASIDWAQDQLKYTHHLEPRPTALAALDIIYLQNIAENKFSPGSFEENFDEHKCFAPFFQISQGPNEIEPSHKEIITQIERMVELGIIGLTNYSYNRASKAQFTPAGFSIYRQSREDEPWQFRQPTVIPERRKKMSAIETLSTRVMVHVYNAMTDGPNIKRFADRKRGQERTLAELNKFTKDPDEMRKRLGTIPEKIMSQEEINLLCRRHSRKQGGKKIGRKSELAGKMLSRTKEGKVNPRRDGTRGHRCYALVPEAGSVSYEKYMELGGCTRDVQHDIAKGRVKAK